MQNSAHQDEFRTKLIDLKQNIKNPFFKYLEKPIERTLSISSLNEAYIKSISQYKSDNYFHSCLKSVGVNYTISVNDLYKIPEKGPLVIVANHPFGGIEGVILGHILSRVRKDFRILGNYLLQQIPELSSWIIPVNPFESHKGSGQNIRGLKSIIKWLSDGGAIIAFPSGEVSHLHLSRGEVTDPQWSPHLGEIVKRTKSTVMPFYFHGRNSAKFQLLGLLNPRIRTVMLPHELVNKKSKNLLVLAGNPIKWKRLESLDSGKSIINFLRLNTYVLKNRAIEKNKISDKRKLQPKPDIQPEEIINPIPLQSIINEINTLPDNQLLINNEMFDVWYAKSDQIPQILTEIGRLREVTFRKVNEGTGKSLDLDQYDDYYSHLFLWNKEKQEIAGAYRLGLTNDILNKYGMKGLYTNSLFNFKSNLRKYITDAVELGRSFVVSEYQKSPSALSLLWKGIAEFVLHHPGYSKLFGPVSISQDYHNVSKSLIVQFLQPNRIDPELFRNVIPKNPFKDKSLNKFQKTTVQNDIRDIENISVLVSEIEKDGKGIPILLHHYLKLNAKMMGFNVDPDFSDVLDCLIMVDLKTTDSRILQKFMGKEGYENFITKQKQIKTLM